MSSRKTVSPQDLMSYLCGLATRIWTSFWRREGSAGMDMWKSPMVQSRQPLAYRLMESVCLGDPRWHGSSWHRGIAESGSSLRSTLMIDIPGNLVRDLPCVQQASYLEGGLLMLMLPLYLHVNQNSDDDDDDDDNLKKIFIYFSKRIWRFPWNINPFFLWKKQKRIFLSSLLIRLAFYGLMWF